MHSPTTTSPCSLVLILLVSSTILWPPTFAGIGDHDQEAIDEIRAYVESLANDPASPYRQAMQSAESMPPLDTKEHAALHASPPAQFCSADSHSDCIAQQSSSPELPLPKDFSNMDMAQMLDELVALTQNHPEQVESAIKSYKQMMRALEHY